MVALLVYSQKKKGDFILKGLQYENLSIEGISDEIFFQNPRLLDRYDGVILLLDSPDDVQEYTASVRRQKPKIPLLVMAEREHPTYADLKMEERIDFFFVRPFPLRSIANTMKYAIYSAKEDLENSRFILRDLELDVLTHTVRYGGKVVPLRNKEFALLHFLMANHGRVLSRSAILESVWDHNSNFLTNTVDVHISQLRKKIDAHTEEKFIHTIPCTGYLFV